MPLKIFFMTYFLLNILVFAVGLTIYNLFYQNLLLVYANLITVICVMYNCHSFITIPFALLFCAIVVIHNTFIYVKIQQVVLLLYVIFHFHIAFIFLFHSSYMTSFSFVLNKYLIKCHFNFSFTIHFELLYKWVHWRLQSQDSSSF